MDGMVNGKAQAATEGSSKVIQIALQAIYK